MANSPLLQIPLLSASQAAKETTINTAISYLERAMNDAKTIPFAGGNFALTETDFYRYFLFKAGGAGGSSILTVPAKKRLFVVDNIANGNALTITCGSSSKSLAAGAIAVLYCDGSALVMVANSATGGGGGGGSTTFLGLTDTFSSYGGNGKYILRVKSDETGVEAHQIVLADISDVDLSGLADGYVLTWSATLNKFVAAAPSGGGSASLDGIAWKQPVTVATTEYVVITDTGVGSVIDGVTLTEGMRVLLKDQIDLTENGIYVVPSAGQIVRSSDFDSAIETPTGTTVMVSTGQINSLQMFVLNSLPGIIGVVDITFIRQVPNVLLLDLDDVDTTTAPTLGQVLTWDDTAQVARFEDLPPQLPTAGISDDGKLVKWDKTLGKYTLVNPSASSYPPMTGKAGYYLSPDDAEDDAIWRKMRDPVAVIGMYAAGKYTNAEVVSVYSVTDEFSIASGFPGSQAFAAVASTGNVNFTILKNGTSIGSVNFNASVGGVFSGTGATFVAGDLLQITAPASADPTLSDVSISIRGMRT